MEHLETDNKIVKKSQLISQISYFANIVLLLIVLLSEFNQSLSIINDSAHLLFFANIVVFLVFKQILRTEKFSRKLIYKTLIVLVIALIALFIFSITDASSGISPYDLGYHVGHFVLLLTKVLSVLLIFFPTKRRD